MSPTALAARRNRTVFVAMLAALAANVLCTSARADLRGDYLFENDLTSSAGTLPPMTPIGSGQATFHPEVIAGSEDIVYEFPTDNGLEITPLTGMSRNAYSIVMTVRLDHVTGYNRLIDFKGGTSDCGLYVHDGAPEVKCGETGIESICANTWVQIVVTRARNDTFKVWVNARPVLAYFDDTDNATLTADSLRFFRDNDCVAPPCGEESGGAVARITIYDTVVGANFIEDLIDQQCGDLNSSGTITASDALGALKAAVGSGCCQIEFCDVAEPEGVKASDALVILKAAVDQEVELDCD